LALDYIARPYLKKGKGRGRKEEGKGNKGKEREREGKGSKGGRKGWREEGRDGGRKEGIKLILINYFI
jgi:hypothetical protein